MSCPCLQNQKKKPGTRNVKLDPLTDPVYNVKQIIKQSLLLEEHLVEPKKRCQDCICKHFLTICGLQEEALSLAGSTIKKYPLMKDNVIFYNKLFDYWLYNKKIGEHVYLKVAEELRQRRKRLTSIYLLND